MTGGTFPTAPVWRRRGGVTLTQVEEDGFLVVPESEEVFHLNALGRALWDELAEPRDADALTAALAAAFPATIHADIARDVAAFIETLNRAGLIERAA